MRIRNLADSNCVARHTLCGGLALGLFLWFGPSELHANSARDAAHILSAKISPSMLAERPDASTSIDIESFDLSPDGSQLALLYETSRKMTPGENPTPSDYWIDLWNVAEGKTIQRVHLVRGGPPLPLPNGNSTSGPAFIRNFLSGLRWTQAEVVFSPEQKYLIAMAWGKIWLLDSATLSVIRSIDPQEMQDGAPVEICQIDETLFAVVYEGQPGDFRVCLFEYQKGDRVAYWTSKAAPESFSPDGKLAVAPDADIYNGGGVTNLAVLDAHTGVKVKSITVGFKYGRSWLGLGGLAAHGSIVAAFLTNDHIAVIPDGNRDSAGHRSGYSIEIVDVNQGRVIRNVRLKKFGSIGMLAVSPDRQFFLVESIYANPFWFAMESSNPKHFTHATMIFARDGDAPAAVIAFPPSTGDTQPSQSSIRSVPPRISLNAETVTLVANGEVQVFRLQK